MELKYLHTFKTIVEEGGFTKAAVRLCYTQSTITFQMQQLERELSVRLFEKIGRKMALTKAGENLIPYVNEVLLSVEKMKSVGVGLSEWKEEVKIGVAETQLCYNLPSVLKRFRSQAPNTRLVIRSMNCYAIRDALIEGSIDLGIFYQEVGGCRPALSLHRIGEYPMSLVISPGFRADFSEPPQLADLVAADRRLRAPFIINEADCIFRQIFERHMKEKDIVMDRITELWSIPTIKNLVMSDMGFSYLPTFTVEEELRDGRLRAVATELDGRTITAVCGHHKNKWISPPIELLIELVSGTLPDERTAV
ncbi:LysR family transcriptional regulator [Bacilliculturomica massiliensis]|uniref:LysR family transcriptional regulator n=1 Tax=Bacilliculturomica massiliensis TaxID=1917867 RepID=UPI0010313ADB|nr:LysR family transcriptional regulator [Bacilliculturomica massiliensis]